ncbi:MAG: dihydroxyacetone kinase subunit DhaL [Methylococcales bacterium]|nr:dihydroxyacetone kinase subunit DhaL [Methylococcales bacterium]
MSFTPALLPSLIEAIQLVIEANAEEVSALDQAIGDGDHVTNLQRGLEALMAERVELSEMDWAAAFQKMGMSLMSSVGGASGSLYGTLFLALSKAAKDQDLNLHSFAGIFNRGVDAVKQRGRAVAGEKTMLDVYIPVADYLQTAASKSVPLSDVLATVAQVAIAGMESTRDMLATKGRASFLEERSRGHIDAGAKTGQLMICAIVDVLTKQLTTPA